MLSDTLVPTPAPVLVAPPAKVPLKPTRSGRVRFLPPQLQNNLPALSRALPNTFQRPDVTPEKSQSPEPVAVLPSSSISTPQVTPEPDIQIPYINSEPDDFGIYRSYVGHPDVIPDEEVPLEDLCEGEGFAVPTPSNPLAVFGTVATTLRNNIIAPFYNMTVYRLLKWFYNDKQGKSIADLDTLVNEVLLPEDFSQDHLEGFSTQKVLKDMDNYGAIRYDLQPEDGWIETSVKISVPCTGVKQLEADAPAYELKGVFYRKLLEIIKSVFQAEQAKNFHYTPFKLYRQHSSPDKPDVRLHSELYNADAFIEEHEKIQRQQEKRRLDNTDDPSLNVPCAVAGMMLWSDATKIGTWGDQSMWPIYLYFGNQSKYERAKPSAFASHHMAYIPKVRNFSFL